MMQQMWRELLVTVAVVVGCSSPAAQSPSCTTGEIVCEGACTTVASDRANCGACGNACVDGMVCSAGVCAVSCGGGTTNCASACVETTVDPTNCGACGNVCGFANADAYCAASACRLGSCSAGFGDCDGSAANGCEASLQTDAAHCGACDHVCVVANATSVCTQGACGLGTCNAGYANCDGDPTNGCETSTYTLMNCGGCGTTCPARSNATSVCPTGTCGIACVQGYADCNTNPVDGCEVNTQTDNNNCGACNTICTGTDFCSQGVCVPPCTTGQARCNNVCTTVNTVQQCGSCNNVCSNVPNGAAVCTSNETCGYVCNGNYADCNGKASDGCEADLTTDVNNCGACFHACSMTQACIAGGCV